MKKLKNLWCKYILLLCGLFVLHGCATTWKQVDNTIISDSSEGNSTVYFIDDSTYWLGFMYKEGKGGVTIYINNMLLEQLEQNGFKKVYLKPGPYTFSVFSPETVYPLLDIHDYKGTGNHGLVVKENKTYYIVGGFNGAKYWAAPFAGSPYKLIQITADEANVLMKKAK